MMFMMIWVHVLKWIPGLSRWILNMVPYVYWCTPSLTDTSYPPCCIHQPYIHVTSLKERFHGGLGICVICLYTFLVSFMCTCTFMWSAECLQMVAEHISVYLPLSSIRQNSRLFWQHHSHAVQKCPWIWKTTAYVLWVHLLGYMYVSEALSNTLSAGPLHHVLVVRYLFLCSSHCLKKDSMT